MRPPPWVALLVLLLGAFRSFGQNAADPAAPQKSNSTPIDVEARNLVRDVLAQGPDKEATFKGVLKIRDAKGRRTEVPLQYSIIPEEGGWRGVYEARSTPWRGAERLVIVHREGKPNEYLYSPAGGPGEAPKSQQKLAGDAAAIPFAGSDYWLSDLGLEFLHWPEQRLVRDAKIKMRLGRPCKVLESVNMSAGQARYKRVRSWLDADSGALIYAEAFNPAGDRIKSFSLHGLTKVGGQWQPKDLQMVMEKSDSKTQIEFTVTPSP